MKKTLNQIISEAKKYVSDELTFEEIKWLLLEKLSLKDYELILRKEESFECDDFFFILQKAKTIPVSYLLNYQDFYGYRFYVDNNVLIPRNETEFLVEMVLDYININKLKSINICEVGSGSGCLSIALNLELNKLNIENKIISGDISEKALNVAKKNALNLNSDVHFVESDCLENISFDYQILVSNPPYIKKGNYVSNRVLDNEPMIALYAEEDGLLIYRKTFSSIDIKKVRALFFEISPDLVDGLELLKEKYLASYESNYIKDINGFIRYASYIRND